MFFMFASIERFFPLCADAHSYRSRNSGLVTVLRRTLDRAEYVLAHELAHSLGAEHDPPLAPYIMAPQAPETITYGFFFILLLHIKWSIIFL